YSGGEMNWSQTLGDYGKNFGLPALKRLVGHVFSFVIGRDFVTDVEKLRIHSKGRPLRVTDVIGFFSDITEVAICPGSNLLYAVEVLVTEVLGLLLANDNGASGKYIKKHQLVHYYLFFIVNEMSSCS
ncbi:hypothetical protein ACJX0J_042578, partial [Zea mays]